MTVEWRGVFPAVTTQFREDESLDVPGTLEHVDALIARGVQGLVLLGTVGENGSLEPDEKLDLLRHATVHVSGRVPVLAGVAETTTHLARRFAREAADAGVDGLMVLPGMLYKSDRRETLAHFRSVAEATGRPVMIYNNPSAYNVDARPEDLAELASVDDVVAIKESSEDPRRLTDLVNLCGDRFALFCGIDDLALESVLLGAVGWVSGLVNAFPEENRLLWDLATQGRWNEAREVYRWYTPLLHLDTHPKLVQYIKLAAAEQGFGTEYVRAPRLPLEGDERERVLELVRRAAATSPVRRQGGGTARS